MKKNKVLVTGGAGFIGSNLTEFFLNRGWEVVCLDNFSTGKRENIEPFRNHPAYTLLEADIREKDVCMKACRGVDLVCHEAALGSVPRSIADPVTVADTNIGGFVKMLYAAKENGVGRFIYASSSSVYGDCGELPKVEERIGKPLSPYAVTKQTDELFAKNFSEIYGLSVIGLRYFNVFGPRQNPDGEYAAVIPKFIGKLLNHERPRIHGDGTNSRDFTYVANVVKANWMAAEAPEEALGKVYNIAGGERTDLNTLFQILRDRLADYDHAIAELEPEYGENRPGDVPHSLASIASARRYFNYIPEVGVREGLRSTVEWYSANRRRTSC